MGKSQYIFRKFQLKEYFLMSVPRFPNFICISHLSHHEHNLMTSLLKGRTIKWVQEGIPFVLRSPEESAL
jgi:hypothetical protein